MTTQDYNNKPKADNDIKTLLLKVYRERQKAHDKLLECDIMLDKLLHKLI